MCIRDRLKHGADMNIRKLYGDNDTLLLYAIKNMSNKVVKQLIKKNININQLDHDGKNPLMAYLYEITGPNKHEFIKILNILIINWCDMRAKDNHGQYFLQYLGKLCHYEKKHDNYGSIDKHRVIKIKYDDVKESLQMRYMLKNKCIFQIKQNLDKFNRKDLLNLNRDLRCFFK